MKKLTNKEITNNIMLMHQQIARINSMISVFISYINMNKDEKKLKKYIEKQKKVANETKNK